MTDQPDPVSASHFAWLTRGVLAIGTASFFSDVGHEITTSFLPVFLSSTLLAPAFALGLIESLADGASALLKFSGGCVSDRAPGSGASRRYLGGGGYLASLEIDFYATPGNGGANGGIVLGVNAFVFVGPAVGTLLVTATPQVIPSNCTQASIISATFACAQQNVQFGPGGLPLSSNGFEPRRAARGIINQPVLATGQNSLCGVSLPGGFTFSAPRNLLFDNARNTESIGCGVGPTVSPFGGASPFPPYSSTGRKREQSRVWRTPAMRPRLHTCQCRTGRRRRRR